MKFQAVITVDFEAEDVQGECRNRARLEAVLAELCEKYPATSLVVRSRRPRLNPRAAPPAPLEDGVEIVRAVYVS